MKDIELAGLVCARMCHDLASPIGAVTNGAEMIREMGGADCAHELAMVEHSAKRATALIQFHRLALGAHRDPDERISRNELRERIEPALVTPRVALSWEAGDTGEVSLAAARLIGLMLLAARSMVGPGGELKLLLPSEKALPATVTAEGPRVSISEDQRRWIEGKSRATPNSREVEFALLPTAASAASARMMVIEDPGRVTVAAVTD